ncbi:mucin-2 [Biomphalaria glabrata]|nr:mucin-2 [Biomphalaria glabrata]
MDVRLFRMSRFRLPCFVFVVVTSSIVVTNNATLEIAVGQQDVFIGTTTLVLASANDILQRSRRSSGIAAGFPSILSFTFKVGDNDVRLNLKKNIFMDHSPPFYVVRQGKIVREINQEFLSNYAYYQDKESGAAVMVSLGLGHGEYLLTGNYFHAGEEYSIRPLIGNTSLGADHVIYKHFEEANPKVNADISKEMKKDSNTSSSWESSANTTTSKSNADIVEAKYDFILPESSVLTELNLDSPLDISSWDVSEEYRNDSSYNKSTSFSNKVDGLHDRKGSGQEREKRQANVYVVELLVVIDYGVYEVWLNGVSELDYDFRRREALRRIKQFYSFVLNGIDLRYNSVQRNADFTIDVTWAGIVVFDKPDPEFWKNSTFRPHTPRDTVESSAALEAFRNWAASEGLNLPASDHVMLFTGHNLTYGGSVSNAGLAYLGSACNSEYYFSIVEEYFEFRDVAIAAHELGHSLGARHDMDGNTCLSFDRYIMTSRFQFPTFRKAQNPWLFSPCSIDYFKSFIEALNKNDTNCLITKESSTDNKEIQPFLNSLPGEVYAGDDFCRIGDGAESYICRDQHISDYSSICFAGVYCYSPELKQCYPKLPPDGFSCGNKKWCWNGTCQLSDHAPATQGDDCPFGDDPGLIDGKTCTELMRTSRSFCYRALFRARCCFSCYSVQLQLPGCEFGDMLDICQKDQCTSYDLDYARENCCETCSELFYTRSSITRELTTMSRAWEEKRGTSTPTTMDVTSSPLFNVNRLKETHRNAISSPRPNLASEENESSDEKSKKSSKTNRNTSRPRWLQRSDQRNERLSQVLSLLRHNWPDESSLQYLRFLLYILYHTRIKNERNGYLGQIRTLIHKSSTSNERQINSNSSRKETSGINGSILNSSLKYLKAVRRTDEDDGATEKERNDDLTHLNDERSKEYSDER